MKIKEREIFTQRFLCFILEFTKCFQLVLRLWFKVEMRDESLSVTNTSYL